MKSVYYKAAVNAEGHLVLIPGETLGHKSPSACVFTVDEAINLELMDCRPVIVVVERAFMTRSEVVRVPDAA